MNNNPVHWELELDDLILEVSHIKFKFRKKMVVYS